MRLDVRAWTIWLLAVATWIMSNRNPLYTILLLLIVQIVGTVCAQPGQGLKLPILRLGLVMILFSTLFNAFSVHIGETILFQLPASWPLVGGDITLEAAVFGANNGLLLLTLLALFTVFNRVVSTGELVGRLPRAWHHVGVVMLIAVTYVPETTRQWQRIREAQAIRGHQWQGLRSLQPVIMPLLVGGLERAMHLAEAMVARGYGAVASQRHHRRVLWGLLTGLLLVFAGWFWLLWGSRWGWFLLALGVGSMWLLVRRLGQQVVFTPYEATKWQPRDSAVVLTAVWPLTMMVMGATSLAYSPYPQVTAPLFEGGIGLSLLFFLTPAILLGCTTYD